MSPLRDYLNSLDFEMGLLEPEAFDVAILGLVPSADGEFAVCYDSAKVLDVLVDTQGVSREGAEEFFEHNIEGAHIGPNSPVFLDPIPAYVPR